MNSLLYISHFLAAVERTGVQISFNYSFRSLLFLGVTILPWIIWTNYGESIVKEHLSKRSILQVCFHILLLSSVALNCAANTQNNWPTTCTKNKINQHWLHITTHKEKGLKCSEFPAGLFTVIPSVTVTTSELPAFDYMIDFMVYKL